VTIHEFKLETLALLDGGKIPIAFDKLLKQAQMDCKDRPAVKKPRKIVLQMEVTPVVDEMGMLDSVDTTFQLKYVSPPMASKDYNLGVRQKAGQPMLVFNDLSDGNFRQRTIDQDADLDGETNES